MNRKARVRSPRGTPGQPLSPTEQRVLAMLAHDMRRAEVAEALGTSPNTVRNHLSNAYGKLRVTSITGAYLILGWLKPPEVPDDE